MAEFDEHDVSLLFSGAIPPEEFLMRYRRCMSPSCLRHEGLYAYCRHYTTEEPDRAVWERLAAQEPVRFANRALKLRCEMPE